MITYYNFIIKYTAYDGQGKVLKEGKMRAKKKASEFEAKVGLEEWFKKTLPSFNRLVISECYKESILGDMGDLEKLFSDKAPGLQDIFKKL